LKETISLTERQPFVAPGGTLFLLGKSDVFLTTLDGREATITWADLAAFFHHLVALETLALGEARTLPSSSTRDHRRKTDKDVSSKGDFQPFSLPALCYNARQ
jgi:hypothetical protein